MGYEINFPLFLLCLLIQVKRNARFCLKPVKIVQAKDQKKPDAINIQVREVSPMPLLTVSVLPTHNDIT